MSVRDDTEQLTIGPSVIMAGVYGHTMLCCRMVHEDTCRKSIQQFVVVGFIEAHTNKMYTNSVLHRIMVCLHTVWTKRRRDVAREITNHLFYLARICAFVFVLPINISGLLLPLILLLV